VYAYKRSLGNLHTVTALNASEEDCTINLHLGVLNGKRPAILSGSAEFLSRNAFGLRIPRRNAVVLGFGGAQA
jgi:hypothetical protein